MGCCSDDNIQPPTHFIGIGGAGMSAIALVLRRAGCQVTGSDKTDGRSVELLRRAGIPVFIGHDPRNIGDAERVVYTRAVPDDNPELAAARVSGLPVIERAEMLGKLYRLFRRRVSVTGTHGKTSSSAMLASLLVKCGQDPTVLIGGESVDLGGHSRLGMSDMIVAEACEAYESFLHLRSSLAMITNVEADHLDHYGSFANVKRAFVEFISLVDTDGVVVACADDEGLMSLKSGTQRRWISYGFSEHADYRILNDARSDAGQEYTLLGSGFRANVVLPMPGRHYARNSAGAVVSAWQLGVDPQTAADALRDFRGVGRRMELKGQVSGVTVLDDYAHHPTEIRATLSAVLEQYVGRLTVVFQPHLYSRTADLLDDFADALYPAERLIITNVYAARETAEKGVQADALFDAVRKKGHTGAHYIPELHDVAFWLADRLESGDVVLTMGAGDIYQAGEALLRTLKQSPAKTL